MLWGVIELGNVLGEYKQIKTAVAVISFICLFASSLSFAQAQTDSTTSSTAPTTKAAVKSDPVKSDVSGKKTKSTNQSVAQGLSIAESMLLNQSPWGIFFNATARRGLDEYSDTWASVNELSLSYRLDSASALGLSIGYDSVLYEKGGNLFNNVDSDPGRYGMTDLEISYTRPKIWSDKYNRLMWSSSLSFPSSRLSQRNSLQVEVSSGLSLRYQPTSRIIITPSVGSYYRQFRYDTANAMGTQPNSPFGVFYSISGSYILTQKFIGAVSYSQTQRYDFFNDWHTIQSFTGRLIFNATDTLSTYVGYNWRDRMITNEPLFDDDKSLYMIGVGYVF